MLKRMGLFLITNILVIITISFILNLLNVPGYIGAEGLDYSSLAIFCLVWGMVGSFISLALSRIMAKWMMGVRVIDPQNAGEFAWLVQTVNQLSRKANLPMPEVGVWDSPEANAFATGPTKKRALVAVSTGLLRSMNREQLEGVLAHEVAHIQNGDMVTMTLIQGVMNAFIMFLARIVAFAISQNVKEESRFMVRLAVTFAMEIVLGILGMIVVCWFSRQREFRADRGAATLAGRGPMISALEGLQRMYGPAVKEEAAAHASLAAFKISGVNKKGFRALFMTHPPLEDRIASLQNFG